MRLLRHQWPLVLALAALITTLSVIGVPPPTTPAAHAGILSEYDCATGTLSLFNNGDNADWRACSERDSNTLKWRSHISIWCNHGNTPVNCGYIYGPLVIVDLQKNSNVVQRKDNYTTSSNVHLKNFYTDFACRGTALGSYQTIGYSLQVAARSGQIGTEKTRWSNATPYMGSCA